MLSASSSMSIADRTFGTPFHFVTRHALALGLAVVAGLVVYSLPSNWWERSGTVLFFVGVVLLVLVLVPAPVLTSVLVPVLVLEQEQKSD